MNRVDCTTKLTGEYNVKVMKGSDSIFETGWCSNTILSGGLVSLYNTHPLNLIQYLDLGKGSILPGTLGYGLTGVSTLADSAEFFNIINNNAEAYTVDATTRVYYVNFVTKPSPINHLIQEFAVKASPAAGAFARNVFDAPIAIEKNTYIVFEYRLKLNRINTVTTNLPVNTNDGYTFNIPVSTSALSIPHNEVYKPGNKLLLLENTESFPQFNKGWQTNFKYAVGNEKYSTFSSVELGRGIDETTRSYTVSTAFINVSATPIGLYDNISTLMIMRNNDVRYEVEFPYDYIAATRVKFPFTLYNFTNDYFDINGTTFTDFGGIDNIRFNSLTFYYNYTWFEGS